MLKNLFLALMMMIISLSAFATTAVEPVVKESGFMFWFGLVMTVLFAISEALGSIPAIRENGIFQIVVKILNLFAEKKAEEKAALKKADEINKVN